MKDESKKRQFVPILKNRIRRTQQRRGNFLNFLAI